MEHAPIVGVVESSTSLSPSETESSAAARAHEQIAPHTGGMRPTTSAPDAQEPSRTDREGPAPDVLGAAAIEVSSVEHEDEPCASVIMLRAHRWLRGGAGARGWRALRPAQ